MKTMEALLNTPCYLVIYTDAVLEPHIRAYRDKYEHLTKYHIGDVTELDTFRFLSKVKENRQKYHPTKDERTCAESHLVCCSKFELVLKTIKENPFGTSKFGWIDANVGVDFSKICTNYRNNLLLRALDKCDATKFHLQILNVCDKKYIQEENLREYYARYQWLVCGCLFVAGAEVGVPILTDLVRVFERHTELGYGHGEEMFYLEILEKYKDSIAKSYGDYNTILNNFVGIREGFPYILNMAKLYTNYGYHQEAVDCCNKVLREFDAWELELDWPLYFSFVFAKYISLYYVDIRLAKELVSNINHLINTVPQFREEYNKNADFYSSQFKYVEYL